MSRVFAGGNERRSDCLDGFWHFQTDPQDRGETEGWYNGLPAGETCTVPSVWNCDLSLLQYEGAAFYQRELYTDGGTLRFCFEGVMTEATVWLDDMLIGSHYGGFCEFDCIVPHVAAGRHRLTVRADNRFDRALPSVFPAFAGTEKTTPHERRAGQTDPSDSRYAPLLLGNRRLCRDRECNTRAIFLSANPP